MTLNKFAIALALTLASTSFAQQPAYIVKGAGPNFQVVNSKTGAASSNEYASESAAKKEATKQNNEKKKIDKSLNK